MSFRSPAVLRAAVGSVLPPAATVREVCGHTLNGMELISSLLVALAIVVGLWLLAVLLIWLHRPSRELAMPVLRLLPNIVILVRRLLADPATPRSVRFALGFLVVWIVSPIDLLPEFLPGIGPLDDIVVAALVLRWVARRVGREALAARWPGAPDGFRLLDRLL